MKPAEVGVAQQLASQLLACPTPELDRQLVHIGEVAALLPARLGGPLAALAAHLGSLGLEHAARTWVGLFDGRCTLHLSTPGDRAFAEVAAFRALPAHQRPDYLPAVLAYAAARLVAGDHSGQHLLAAYRSRMAELSEVLTARGSVYALAVDVVATTLPVPRTGDLSSLLPLAAPRSG